MASVQAGSVIAGRYRLERPLAKGGMGSVWVARHLHLDTVVAVKFMAPEFAASADARLRFEREAKASAQIKSPHVVHVYDFGVEGDTPFLAMELLDGEDLGNRLKREGRFSFQVTAAILTQVCKGLRRAHEASIVHRDLKPGNIFLQRQDDDEIVKILDFGLAKILGPARIGEETKTGLVMGSLRYMSPEQLQSSKKVDHRSDLWAVGVILYRCLTGKLPFDAEEMADVVIQILRDPIPAPSAVAPDLNAEIDEFFKRALHRDREKRFQSAHELSTAFVALGGERLSIEWQEAASSLMPGSGMPRGEADHPTAKIAPLEKTTPLRRAPPDVRVAPKPIVTMSDLPTVPQAKLPPLPRSPSQSADDLATMPHAVSVAGKPAPMGRSGALGHVLRGTRRAGAAVAFTITFIMAAVVAANALIGGERAPSSEAAPAEKPAPIVNAASPPPQAAPSPEALPAAPASASSSPEVVSTAPVPPAPEATAAAQKKVSPSTTANSGAQAPARPSSSARVPLAKPNPEETKKVLGF
ncbi:MAG: serine/threonine protein kinase [Polyangiaceae bacterium]|nr:serine/threonine protein kinase [Polyangiaceae bacterium]